MTRGLVTIATGNIHYYKIAANLLKSYRLTSETPCPFAIIAEEENEYTALFDKVIITTEAKRSFLDKFLLLKLCPFDENLFFDADSLAFGDLNRYWDFFKDATDFSSLGENFPLNQAGGAWYDVDGIGEYAKRISYKTRIHMGVCFIRRNENTLNLYHDCIDILNNFDKLYFHTASLSKDECVLGLAMPMNNMLAIPEHVDMMACYPCLKTIKANLFCQQLTYQTKWNTSSNNGILVHWGTSQTHEPLYRFNIDCLNYLTNGDSTKTSITAYLLYKYKLKLFLLNVAFVPTRIKRAYKFLKHITKRIFEKIFSKKQ